MVAGCSSPGSVINNSSTNSITLPSGQGDSDIVCTQEVKLCPNGDSVVRVSPSCEFAPCQSISTPVPLNSDTKDDIILPLLSQDEVTFCTQEVRLCPNGSYVGRTLPNCEFTSCPR